MNPPVLHSEETWQALQPDGSLLSQLCETCLPQYLYHCRWFGGKSSTVMSVSIDQWMPVNDGSQMYHLLVLEVYFQESFAHHYFLPLAWVEAVPEKTAHLMLAEAHLAGRPGYLIDALYHNPFHACLYSHLVRQSRLSGADGSIHFSSPMPLEAFDPPATRLLKAEQSNTTVVVEDRYFLKIFRRLFRDTNPDFELNHYLSAQQHFRHSPRLTGLIYWHTSSRFEISLGLMQEKVAHQGDAWGWMNEQLAHFYQYLDDPLAKVDAPPTLKPLAVKQVAAPLRKELGEGFFKKIQLLGQRTAELHLALAAERRNRDFVPIPYNSDFTVWLKNRLIFQFEARYNLLQKKRDALPPQAQEMAEEITRRKDEIINFILSFDEERLNSYRIRIHGDYHLGQILVQPDDFYILDFEGEPESTIRDRKVKQSPLKDVAGLFRSFHYALFAVLFAQRRPQPSDLHRSKVLYHSLTGVFLDRYLSLAHEHNLAIGYHREVRYLLDYFLLEKAIYELGYELNGRPHWAIIPLRGILEILDEIEPYE